MTDTPPIWQDQSFMFGESRAMKPVFSQVVRASQANVPALVRGEPGTGKGRLARMIHEWGPRKHGPFVEFRVLEVAAPFVEEQLLGVHRARVSDQGYLAAATGGTLFIDQANLLPRDTQRVLAGMLRELRTRHSELPEWTPHARVIVSCCADPDGSTGGIGLDGELLCEFGEGVVSLPALRERREDIPTMAHRMARGFAHDLGKRIARIAPEAMNALLAHSWGGNQAELARCLEQAVAACAGDTLALAHLPLGLRTEGAAGEGGPRGLSKTLDYLERALIVEALRHTRGHQARAAGELGITTRVMGLRVRKHRIEPWMYRTEA